MDTVSYGDRRVAALIAEDFVPVRVDADRRPDVNDRYNLDGWPTTVLLTPSGEMLTGTTYLPADGLLTMLDEVARAYRSGRDALDQRADAVAAARRARPRALSLAVDPDLAAPDWLADLIVREVDAEYGGFGADGKFLHIAALTAGVRQHARDPDARDWATRWCARSTRWPAAAFATPSTAGSSAMPRRASGCGRTPRRCSRIRSGWSGCSSKRPPPSIGPTGSTSLATPSRYVQQTLADRADGRFFASQAADEGFYQLASAALRRTFTPPHVDRTLFTDWTAQAASVWIFAGERLHDPALSEFGGRALDGALVASYRPGEGLAHYVDGRAGVRGLLTDQVYAARALLDLHEATANPTWSMMAEELMRTAVRTLWDERAGGFFDRPATGPDVVGMLADPLKPLAANCAAATVLARLARLTGDADLQQRALDTLRGQTTGYREQGLFGAPYVLAVLEMFGDDGR